MAMILKRNIVLLAWAAILQSFILSVIILNISTHGSTFYLIFQLLCFLINGRAIARCADEITDNIRYLIALGE